MNVDEKIFEFLKRQKGVKNASLNGVKITKGQNKDGISEIFENKTFDNLKVRDGIATSSIESIMVAINQDNYASLAVAKKLGFNENGILNMTDYCRQLESQLPKKI